MVHPKLRPPRRPRQRICRGLFLGLLAHGLSAARARLVHVDEPLVDALAVKLVAARQLPELVASLIVLQADVALKLAPGLLAVK